MAIDNWVIGKIVSTHDENDVVTVYASAIDNLGLNGQQNKSFSFRLKEWEFDVLHRVACINRHVKSKRRTCSETMRVATTSTISKPTSPSTQSSIST